MNGPKHTPVLLLSLREYELTNLNKRFWRVLHLHYVTMFHKTCQNLLFANGFL